ncbi:hypothetical protein DH2020_027394 [Rehmannia glutinosa]|uniref:Kinesin motor domain-containing protein n=1 Tax=Rehmannia glutinosa TaxID=99300 RepID=A0ABR0VX86_REHGL
MEKICVAVRVRPSANEESVNGFHWKVESNRISLHRSHGTPISGVSFAFDHVFDQECSNARVYELLTKDIIGAAVEGFNGTAFAYGQTSSGKTFTMNGSENDPGIIHRAVKDIFAKIQKTSDREFLIRVSYMEIYNEDINDLFAVENQKLQIHESLERGVFVAGLREEIVNSADQVLNLIQLGEANRHFGDTNMNARSSRSHTIFRMVIESKAKDKKSGESSGSDDAIRVSVLLKLERGVRLKEGKHINKSLMILGNVINKLSGAESKELHWYIQIHVEETKGTLQFASRAKRITNCVQVNEHGLYLVKFSFFYKEDIDRWCLIEATKTRNRGTAEKTSVRIGAEKLAAELEEERRSHKERDQCIKEQQMKIDNLSNLVTLSDSDRSSSHDGVKECLQDESTNSNSMRQEDAFSTPCFKAAPNAFVAKRSHYLAQPECSPLPDTFGDFVDEDTWMKMNKGFIADLDSLHMTPARKVQSFPISEDFIADEKSATAQILSTASEVGNCLFSTLESHLNMAMDGKKPSPSNDNSIRDLCNILHQKLSGAISSLVLSDQSTLNDEDKEDSVFRGNIKGNLGGQIACWKQAWENEAKTLKQKYSDLEKELEVSNQLLKVSEGKYRSLERIPSSKRR